MPKEKIQTLLTKAVEKSPPPAPVVEVVTIPDVETLARVAVAARPVPTEPWYKTALRPYIKDLEKLTFLAEQIQAQLEFGGENNIVRMPQEALLSILRDLKIARHPCASN